MNNKELISSFMHELKTPLAVVRSHLESEIIDESLPLYLRKKLVLDVEELARLNHLINEMNQLLNSSSNINNSKLKSGSLLELLVNLIEFVEPFALEKQQKLSLIANENIIINMNSKKLHQLLFNLLINAIKYTPKQGRIMLTLSQSQKYIEIEIKDTGIGISKQHQEKIFRPFYRIKEERVKGSGLGLAIVLSIAKQYNFKIALQSKEKKGSSFFLYIPKENLCQ